MTVFEFKPISPEEIEKAIQEVLEDDMGIYSDIVVSDYEVH